MKSMLISMLMACSTATALAQDHSRAQSAVDTKLLVENEFVQVVRISIPPHGKTSMHDVSPRIVIWMADAHFADRYADGTVREEMRKAGSAEWVSARRHAGENMSDKPMDFIVVTVKRAQPGQH
jgi:hypothetical protein